MIKSHTCARVSPVFSRDMEKKRHFIVRFWSLRASFFLFFLIWQGLSFFNPTRTRCAIARAHWSARVDLCRLPCAIRVVYVERRRTKMSIWIVYRVFNTGYDVYFGFACAGCILPEKLASMNIICRRILCVRIIVNSLTLEIHIAVSFAYNTRDSCYPSRVLSLFVKSIRRIRWIIAKSKTQAFS